MKVFLGGTCNGSPWRDRLIPLLTIDYFNPVVENWTAEAQAEELRQREECDIVLYVITPRMEGVYSIAKVVDDSNKRPERTAFVVIPVEEAAYDEREFGRHQLKSLQQVSKMVIANGGTVLKDLEAAARWLNTQSIKQAQTL